jgi:hypothetical protein
MLEQALLVDRTVLRVPAMRSSMYLLPPDLVPAGPALLSDRNFDWLNKAIGVDASGYRRLADVIERALAGTTMTARELRDEVDAPDFEGPRLTYVLRQMSNEGRIVRTGTRGGIRSQRFEYAVMSEWVELPVPRPSLPEALLTLTPLWLRAHGPATAADLAWWAGVRLEHANRALDHIGAERVAVDGLAGELWDLPGRPSSVDGVTGVVLVPVWDAYVMSHRDRSRYLDERWRDYVVDLGGNTTNVILRDGEAAGQWDLDAATLLYAAFESLDAGDVARAADRLRPTVTIDQLIEVPPQSLAARGQNAFQAPLRS